MSLPFECARVSGDVVIAGDRFSRRCLPFAGSRFRAVAVLLLCLYSGDRGDRGRLLLMSVLVFRRITFPCRCRATVLVFPVTGGPRAIPSFCVNYFDDVLLVQVHDALIMAGSVPVLCSWLRPTSSVFWGSWGPTDLPLLDASKIVGLGTRI